MQSRGGSAATYWLPVAISSTCLWDASVLMALAGFVFLSFTICYPDWSPLLFPLGPKVSPERDALVSAPNSNLFIKLWVRGMCRQEEG